MQITIRWRDGREPLVATGFRSLKRLVESAAESGEDLGGADLGGAHLLNARLQRAKLSGADLSSAELSGANLHLADLSGAALTMATLRGANLRGADLRGADLGGARLWGADLRGARLEGARFDGAMVRRARFDGGIPEGASGALFREGPPPEPPGPLSRARIVLLTRALLPKHGRSTDEAFAGVTRLILVIRDKVEAAIKDGVEKGELLARLRDDLAMPDPAVEWAGEYFDHRLAAGPAAPPEIPEDWGRPGSR